MVPLEGQDTRETEGDEYVILGTVSGIYGVHGWVKVFSHTQPRENILTYSPWYLNRGNGWQEWQLEKGRPQGKGIVAKLAACDDRDAAASLMKAEIGVQRSQLNAELGSGRFYWADLKGLSVITRDAVDLGVIDHLFETGSNDVMVVKGDRERLIPYIWQQVVQQVDLAAGQMIVDWDPDF